MKMQYDFRADPYSLISEYSITVLESRDIYIGWLLKDITDILLLLFSDSTFSVV